GLPLAPMIRRGPWPCIVCAECCRALLLVGERCCSRHAWYSALLVLPSRHPRPLRSLSFGVWSPCPLWSPRPPKSRTPGSSPAKRQHPVLAYSPNVRRLRHLLRLSEPG